MSGDNTNLLLELLQHNEPVFNLDDLGQSPRTQDEAFSASPGPPAPHQSSSPHQRAFGEHAAPPDLWQGEMPSAWTRAQQPQQHAASWGPDNTGFTHAAHALPQVATAARGMSAPQHFWQPQAALATSSGAGAPQEQAQHPWQARQKPDRLPGLVPSMFGAQRVASFADQQSPFGSHGQYGTPSSSAQDMLATQMQYGVGIHPVPLTRRRSASCEPERSLGVLRSSPTVGGALKAGSSEYPDQSRKLKRPSSGVSESDEAGGSNEKQDASDHLTELKDRNRLAQRKYRQKRKERLQSTEDRLAYLEAKVEALSLDKETLSYRNAALEDFLLRQQAKMQQRRRGSQDSQQNMASPGHQWLDDHTRRLVKDITGLAGVEEVVLTVREDAPARLTTDQLLAIPPDGIQSMVRQYVDAMAECILPAEQQPDSAAARRLGALHREISQVKAAILLRDFSRMESAQLLGSSLTSAPRPPPDVLRALVASAQLSDGQAAALLRMRRQYLHNLGALMRRRTQLSAVLKESEPSAEKEVLELDLHMAAVAASEALHDALRAERTFAFQLQMLVWCRVLAPIQAARIAVQTIPAYKLDTLTFLNALADVRNDSSASVLLEQGQAQDGVALLPIDAVASLQLPPRTPSDA